jgi:hypothetical protein
MKRTSISLLILACSIVLLVSPLFALQNLDESNGARARVAAPEMSVCDRNQLTSFNGVVSHYRRDTDVTVITILTDWDTVETVTLEHTDPDGVMQYFKLRGRVFTYNDWAEIEIGHGVLHDGIRVIAWICLDDITPPVIDWQP